MSAIDWLSDSVAKPRVQSGQGATDVAHNALPDKITVEPLGGSIPDAVGLLSPTASGLPADLWHSSTSGDIARRFRADRVDILPAVQDLLYLLLLAELDPPADSGPKPNLLLARIDTLLALGALEQADSLLSHVAHTDPQVFRRAFDISLLLRTEDKSCALLRATPSLTPTFPARIFCLARGGDWDAAALTLETGRALGFVSPAEDALMARFLESDVAQGAPALPIPQHPSPLEFRIHEAIGEPMPTTKLPRAFAHADLHTNTGWKAQIEAAERLVKTGAVDPNKLLGLYTERRPAASGGVWDRVAAIQAFEKALQSGDSGAVSAALRPVWRAMESIEIEVAFAQVFAEKLGKFDLPTSDSGIALRIGLLSRDYQELAKQTGIAPSENLLANIALGRPGPTTSGNQLEAAIQDGFRTIGIPVRLQSLTQQGRMGEAILRAMEMFENGARGDLDELTDALIYLRAVGLEDTARRAALQLLILERRG
ncbi:MAG: hypothetical protein KUG69_02720 [Marinosulfonomonas sp.]|nr:hypothetical protein [Marinosulfonomonas sp.]